MQSLVLFCFAALISCTYAKVHYQPRPPGFVLGHPDAAYYYPYHRGGRHSRDLTWERNAGRGKVFGTLGNTDDSLFGKAGYKQDIFNDERGHLQGQAYGSKVLGDRSVLGSKFDWSNDNARAALDVHKEMGRGSGVTLTGEGVWKLDKNTRFVAGGNLEKQFGHSKPEFGIQGGIEHDF